ncbi:MAG TPA: DUF2218 domain-containing protein, partial [Micromonospora sp.]
FCRHAAAMGTGGHALRMRLHALTAPREVRVAAEWTERGGTVTFTPWGRCTLAATADALTLRVDAADEDGLTRIRDVVTRDFERFSRREPLSVSWQRSEPDSAAPGDVAPRPRRGFSRFTLRAVLLALAVALVISLHLGLLGTVVAQSRWTGIAVDVVVALVALKIGLVLLARYGLRRVRAARASDRT